MTPANLKRLKDALIYASAEAIQARDAFFASEDAFVTVAMAGHPQGPHHRTYQAALDNLMASAARHERARAASTVLTDAVLEAEEKSKRKLYAVVSSTGEVLGGAPFDAESLEAAQVEVTMTLKLAPGDRVVPLTPKLKKRYATLEGT